MELTENRKIVILLICIITLLTLSGMIYSRGKDNSCNKCSIEFSQTYKSGMQLQQVIIINEKPINLFGNLTQGKCVIEWDDVQGYYYG